MEYVPVTRALPKKELRGIYERLEAGGYNPFWMGKSDGFIVARPVLEDDPLEIIFEDGKPKYPKVQSPRRHDTARPRARTRERKSTVD